MQHSCADMGFHAGKAEVYRCYARLRLARSYKGLSLEGYTAPTVEAYSELMRVFLVFSAFEQFLKLYKLRFFELEQLATATDSGAVAITIRNADKKSLFISFLCRHTHADLRKRLELFISGASHNPAIVAAAVRHVFAHGILAPHSGRIAPRTTTSVCQLLSEWMLDYIDEVFDSSIQEFCKRINFPTAG